MATAGAIRGGQVAIEIGADVRRFYAALDRVQKRISSLGATFAGIGARMAGVGAAAATPFVASLAQSAKFQDTMSAVGAVTDATGAEFDALKQKALELGASTSFTAQQVAEGMQALGQGGFTVEETLSGIEGTLLLARAGMLDLAQATSITVAILRSFKMPTEDAAKVADILSKAANSSNATVQGLGEALSTVGGIAATAGASLTEITAAIGLLADRGMQGSEAGTALRRVLIGLSQEQKQLKKLGVEVKDPKTGKLKPLKQILVELRAAMQGMDQTDQIAKLSKIFDVFGANAIMQLMNSGDALEELDAKLQDSRGSAAKTAKAMDDNLGGSFRIFMSAVESASLAIGEALTPAMRALLDQGARLAAGLAVIINENKAMVVAIAKAVAGVVAFGGALIGVGLSLQVVAVGVGGFTNVLKLALSPMFAIVDAAKLIVGSFASIGNAAIGIGSNLIKATAAVVAFAAQAAYMAASYVGSLAVMVATTVASAIAIAASWTGAAIAGMAAYLAYVKALVTYYTGALASITAITISRTGAMAGAWIASAGAAVSTFISGAVAGLASYVAATAAAASATVASVTRMAAAWLAPVAPLLAIGVAVAAIGPAIVAAFSQSGGLASSIGSLFEPLSAGFQTVLADATKVFSDLWGIALETFGGISDAITAGDMSLAFDVLWAGLAAAWLRGQAGVMSYVDQFVEYIQNRMGDASTWLAKAMLAALGMIERAWISTTGVLFSAWQTAINSVLDLWDTAIGAIQKAIAYIRSFFDKSIDYDAIKKQIDDANKQRREERDAGVQKGKDATDRKLGDSRQQEADAKKIVDEQNQQDQKDRAERTAQRADERQQQVNQSQQGLADKRDEAAGAKRGSELVKLAAEATNPDELRAVVEEARRLAEAGLIKPEMLAKIEQAVDDAAAEIDKTRAMDAQNAEKKAADEKKMNDAANATEQSKKEGDIAGTFSAAAVSGIAYSQNLAERTAKACEETARNTKQKDTVGA